MHILFLNLCFLSFRAYASPSFAGLEMLIDIGIWIAAAVFVAAVFGKCRLLPHRSFSHWKNVLFGIFASSLTLISVPFSWTISAWIIHAAPSISWAYWVFYCAGLLVLPLFCLVGVRYLTFKKDRQR